MTRAGETERAAWGQKRSPTELQERRKARRGRAQQAAIAHHVASKQKFRCCDQTQQIALEASEKRQAIWLSWVHW